MKQFYLSILLVSFFSGSAFSQETKKVLFLGNSYTAVNNLPEMVSSMAESTENNLIYDTYTPGGYRFMDHASDANSLGKISSDAWDFVVLQGQSQETAFPQTQLNSEVYPYAKFLVDDVRQNNACSIPLFYMTWGRKNGDPVNCEFAPWFCNYKDMDDYIKNTYISLTEENHAQVSPVGAVWRYLKDHNTTIELFAADDSHPSEAGTYVAACTFYTMIYKADPTAITWNSNLSEEDADTLRETVKAIVFDSLPNWEYTLQPEADFSGSITDAKVSFTNLSTHSLTYEWDFGDSNTSNEENPIHIYKESGEYMVSLTVDQCNETDTKIKTLIIDTVLKSPDFKTDNLIIYPNPVKNTLHLSFSVKSDKMKIAIVDVSGKVVRKKSIVKSRDFVLDLSSLNPGIYFLKLNSYDKVFFKQIIKQ